MFPGGIAFEKARPKSAFALNFRTPGHFRLQCREITPIRLEKSENEREALC